MEEKNIKVLGKWKYLIIFFICLAAIYLSYISKIIFPLIRLFLKFIASLQNKEYGNFGKESYYVESIVQTIIILIELIVIGKVLKKKLDYQLVRKDTDEYSTKKTILLFILTIIPIIIISAIINWDLKFTFEIGRTNKDMIINYFIVCIQYSIKYIFLIAMIESSQKFMEENIQTKYPIPWGGIFAFCTFGIIEFILCKNITLRWFYLLIPFYFGILYLVGNKRYWPTYTMAYIIFLL